MSSNGWLELGITKQFLSLLDFGMWFSLLATEAYGLALPRKKL